MGTSYVFSFFKTLRLKSELWVKKSSQVWKRKKKKTCPLFLPDVTKDDCVKKLLVMNRFSYKVLCFNLKNVDRLWMLPKPWQKAVEDRRTMTLVHSTEYHFYSPIQTSGSITLMLMWVCLLWCLSRFCLVVSSQTYVCFKEKVKVKRMVIYSQGHLASVVI